MKYPDPISSIADIGQFDLSELSAEDLKAELNDFDRRLRRWADVLESAGASAPGTVSVETPVIKGGWLIPCIESILYQTATDWTYSLLWDEGDDLSKRILERVARFDHPKLRVHFGPNLGVARARRFLTEHSRGDYILTIDDDDMMDLRAIEALLGHALDHPWSGIVRARRRFIDEFGAPLDQDAWFPFEARHYEGGMVTDIQNHSQPNLIRRAAYERTGGWEGFEDFLFAGEDCDLYLKLEEVASVELLDDVLYYYRLHGKRTSHRLTADGAFEMWRRLADKTIGRRGLPLERVTDRPPFRYRRLETARPEPADVDWIVVESEPSGGDLKAVTTAALRACGAREDAIHVVKPGLSLAAARNEGFRGTCRRIVFFIDSGVAPESPDVIDQILEAMHESDADLAAPLLLAPDGHVYGPGGFDENLRPILYRGGASDSARSRRVPGAAWLPAEALAVRREVIRSVGGFDEQQLSGVFAEADFCLKARSRGFRCTSAGTMSATTNPAEPDGSRGLDVFARKWGAQTTLFEDEVPKIV